MVGLLHQQTQQSDWCAVRSVSAGKWTKNQMHRRGEAIVQTIHWMQEVRILPVLIVITCVCTFPTCDHYCICIGVSFKLSANWNLWQTTDDRRREYRECGEIEFQAVTATVLISSPGRMEAGMATVIIIQAGPGRCPLVQYLHTGGTIQYPHTTGPAELAIITRCGRTVTLARGRRGSLLVFQSTHSAITLGAVVPAVHLSISSDLQEAKVIA